MNYIREYHDKIQSGEIVVNDHIKTLYEKILQDLDNPGDYTFDVEKATKPIELAPTSEASPEASRSAPLSRSHEIYGVIVLQIGINLIRITAVLAMHNNGTARRVTRALAFV